LLAAVRMGPPVADFAFRWEAFATRLATLWFYTLPPTGGGTITEPRYATFCFPSPPLLVFNSTYLEAGYHPNFEIFQGAAWFGLVGALNRRGKKG